MIKSLAISNFRSIKDEVLFSFEASRDARLEDAYCVQVNEQTRLLKMVLIYGANASGKTNIIRAFEALRLLVGFQPQSRQQAIESHQPFKTTADLPTTFVLNFFVKEDGPYKEYEYRLVFDKHVVREEDLYYWPKQRRALLFSRKTDAEGVSHISFGSTVKLDSKHKEALSLQTLSNMTVLSAYERLNILVPSIRAAKQWFDHRWMPAIMPRTDIENWAKSLIEEVPRLKKLAIELIQEADFSIADFEIEALTTPTTSGRSAGADTLSKRLLFVHTPQQGQPYILSEEEESSGTMRYFGLASVMLALLHGNSFLAIDELDHSLHFDLLRHFLKTYLQNAEEAQLLVSLHHVSLLQERELLRNDALWFTERNPDGSTQLYALTDFSTDAIRPDGNIYNPYMRGQLGGKPILGSTRIDLTSMEHGQKA